MKIEIITTGDEILSGNIVDTNTAWISDKCWSLGFLVAKHTTVGDDREAIISTVLNSKTNDVVIITGGLGPTSDDITNESVADAFGKKLILDKSSLKNIEKMLFNYGRGMNESQTKQAYIPEGAKALENNVGTAPGVQMKVGKTMYFILPGVPKEMEQIFDDSVLPWLKEKSEDNYQERIIRCFGMAEATINERLRTLNLVNVKLSYRMKYPEILIKLVARQSNKEASLELLKKLEKEITKRLGDVVYGGGDKDLAQVVAKLLLKNKFTIAVAESCTGGFLANWITDNSGSSKYFERGVVTYSDQSKKDILDVPLKVLNKYGAVSKEAAIAMASGLKKMSDADIAISITGVAGPAGGSKDKPVGTVFIGMATPEDGNAWEFHYPRDRKAFKQLVAATALNVVRLFLLKR